MRIPRRADAERVEGKSDQTFAIWGDAHKVSCAREQADRARLNRYQVEPRGEKFVIGIYSTFDRAFLGFLQQGK